MENFGITDRSQRIAQTLREFLNLRDYIRMNEIESSGFKRAEARSMVQVEKVFNRRE